MFHKRVAKRLEIASHVSDLDNQTMTANEWERRIARAERLGAEHSSAAEFLRFYAAIARFQGKFYEELKRIKAVSSNIASEPFATPLGNEVIGRFRDLLMLVEEEGPASIRETAHDLRSKGEGSHLDLLNAFWSGRREAEQSGSIEFFARAYLQPYAAKVREDANLRWTGPTPYLCPFCKRKPGLGILRPMGDGGQRSLLCSLCLGEWEFRRIVCPGCGEEDYSKLPVYIAEELKHVRVEGCDSCRCYIKTVDMTKSGLAEPLVDEIAAIPLDVWAQKQGYSKLQLNLLQL